MINDLLKEYSADYFLGSKIVSVCINLFTEWDKKSSTIEKVKRVKEILRKSKGNIVDHPDVIKQNKELQQLMVDDARLAADVEAYSNQNLRQD